MPECFYRKVIGGRLEWGVHSGVHGKNIPLTAGDSLLLCGVGGDSIPFILALVCLITSLAMLFMAPTGVRLCKGRC